MKKQILLFFIPFLIFSQSSLEKDSTSFDTKLPSGDEIEVVIKYSDDEKKTEVKEEAKTESEEPEQVENGSNGSNGAPVSAAQIAAMESQDLTSSDISTPVVDDPNVLKSEIDDIRKSVVSMSVGQPARTSTIVKEWLEQPAPESSTPAPEEQSNDDSGGGEEESGEE